HEAAGQRPLGKREPGPARQEDRRAPPGVLHEGQRGARLLHVLDALTGVGRGPDGPRGGDGLTLVLVAHLLVVLEAARAQDDAAAGTEGLLLAVPGDGDADDLLVDPGSLGDQAGHGRLAP